MGKITLTITTFMAILATMFVTYRLFGGQEGPSGFSILGINKLIFPLYMFFIAYLLVRRNTNDQSRTIARKWAIGVMIVVTALGLIAAVASGNRPYITGKTLYDIEINLSDFIVSAIIPLAFAYYDMQWKFQDFPRSEKASQHGLRIVIGTVFLIYASAPWNYFTNWIYSTIFGPLGLGHLLLYSGSPFLILYLVFRWNTPMRTAALQFMQKIHIF